MSAHAPGDEHLVIRPTILYPGTPVLLLGSQDAAGAVNLAPASSSWALGRMLVLGLEDAGQTLQNLREVRELTVNYPQPALWRAVEAIGDTTARVPVPREKAGRYRSVGDKFALAGLTAQRSDLVAPPRVRECALQVEATVRRITPGIGEYAMVEIEAVRVHALPEIVVPGTDHIDPLSWEPMIYSFRHYFALGPEHGHRPNTDARRT